MAAVPIFELDQFYFHFKSLLFSGFKASLVVNSENGEASVTLTAGLGPINNCKVVKKNKKKRSPSYFNRLEKRRNDRKSSEVANQDEAVAEKVIVSTDDVATENKVDESPSLSADEAVTVAVDGSSEEMVDKEEINKAEKATPNSSGAVKQPETERRYWLCIFHGCIDNTELEDLECSCCGIECQVVEYDSEEEYEPPWE